MGCLQHQPKFCFHPEIIFQSESHDVADRPPAALNLQKVANQIVLDIDTSLSIFRIRKYP